ncbi:hypothetical protein KL943_003367 [Ogataea angusta]|nr:hypothetical protein KL943_003367 [Ogataea angusta]
MNVPAMMGPTSTPTAAVGKNTPRYDGSSSANSCPTMAGARLTNGPHAAEHECRDHYVESAELVADVAARDASQQRCRVDNGHVVVLDRLCHAQPLAEQVHVEQAGKEPQDGHGERDVEDLEPPVQQHSEVDAQHVLARLARRRPHSRPQVRGGKGHHRDVQKPNDSVPPRKPHLVDEAAHTDRPVHAGHAGPRGDQPRRNCFAPVEVLEHHSRTVHVHESRSQAEHQALHHENLPRRRRDRQKHVRQYANEPATPHHSLRPQIVHPHSRRKGCSKRETALQRPNDRERVGADVGVLVLVVALVHAKRIDHAEREGHDCRSRAQGQPCAQAALWRRAGGFPWGRQRLRTRRRLLEVAAVFSIHG